MPMAPFGFGKESTNLKVAIHLASQEVLGLAPRLT